MKTNEHAFALRHLQQFVAQAYPMDQHLQTAVQRCLDTLPPESSEPATLSVAPCYGLRASPWLD